MRIPRDLGGEELARLLKRYGYEITRQLGTLNSVLKDVAEHLKLSRDELIESLFEK